MLRSLTKKIFLILIASFSHQLYFMEYLITDQAILKESNPRQLFSNKEQLTPIHTPIKAIESNYSCNLLDFRNHWACSLYGIIIASNFTLDNASLNNTNLHIDEYPSANINNITVFESFENNIIVPIEYIDFFFAHYFNDTFCSKIDFIEQTKVYCRLDKWKNIPSVIFFMKDFGIIFHEDYPSFFTSFTSKFIFRKGIDHWIFGHELIKNYTLAVNRETKIIKITSNDSNNSKIIPFKWPTKELCQKVNLIVFITIVLFIGLLIIVLIKRRIKRSIAVNQKNFLDKEITNTPVYQMYLSK